MVLGVDARRSIGGCARLFILGSRGIAIVGTLRLRIASVLPGACLPLLGVVAALPGRPHFVCCCTSICAHRLIRQRGESGLFAGQNVDEQVDTAGLGQDQADKHSQKSLP
jgi:hypothetical protein